MFQFDESKARKWRKKPVVIEAYQTDVEVTIPTLEGDHKASPGDFIIRGVAGECYPCKMVIFGKTYEPAECPARTDEEWVKHFESVYQAQPGRAYGVMTYSWIRCPVCGSPLVHVYPQDMPVGHITILELLCAEDPRHKLGFEGAVSKRLA